MDIAETSHGADPRRQVDPDPKTRLSSYTPIYHTVATFWQSDSRQQRPNSQEPHMPSASPICSIGNSLKTKKAEKLSLENW